MNRKSKQVLLTHEAPDKNCISLPDGGCIGSDCMHSLRCPTCGITDPREDHKCEGTVT